MTRPTSLRTAHALSTLAAVIALTACASSLTGPSATAQLKPTTGNTTSGTVQFVQKGKQVQVSAMVNGLKPGAVHGFHIHEKAIAPVATAWVRVATSTQRAQPMATTATVPTTRVTCPA